MERLYLSADKSIKQIRKEQILKLLKSTMQEKYPLLKPVALKREGALSLERQVFVELKPGSEFQYEETCWRPESADRIQINTKEVDELLKTKVARWRQRV